MKIILKILFFAILISITGCTEGTQVEEGPIPIEGDVIACTSDEDCAVVNLGCCPDYHHTNSVAVNIGYEEEVSARNGESCQDEQPCLAMGYIPLLARCTEGTCEHYPDPSYAIPPEEFDE